MMMKTKKKKIDNYQIFYEHMSSIPDSGEDYGINVFGVNYMYELK